MKKTTQKKSSLKASFVLALLFSFVALTALPTTSQAQTFIKSSTPGVEVNYLGVEDDQLGFAVKFKNEKGEKFTLSVKDKDGSTIYSEKYTAKNLLKKFLFRRRHMKMERRLEKRLRFITRKEENMLARPG